MGWAGAAGEESISRGGGAGANASASAPLVIRINSSLTMPPQCAGNGQERLNLFGGVERRLIGFGGFDLGGFLLDQTDDVIDHVGVLHMVVGDARQIDHVRSVAASGEAD